MSKIKYVAYRGQGFVIIKVGENGITDITIGDCGAAAPFKRLTVVRFWNESMLLGECPWEVIGYIGYEEGHGE